MGAFIGRSRDTAAEKGSRIPSAPSTRQPKGKATPEDTEDIQNLVQGVFAGTAAMTGFTGWVFSDAEAKAIAEPAARILARHKVVQGYVRDVADPVALIVAVGLPTFARWQLYNMWKYETARIAAANARAASAGPTGEYNGATSGPSVVERMRGL